MGIQDVLEIHKFVSVIILKHLPKFFQADKIQTRRLCRVSFKEVSSDALQMGRTHDSIGVLQILHDLTCCEQIPVFGSDGGCIVVAHVRQ